MDEWEYFLLETPGMVRPKLWPQLTQTLNELGQQGWEAVGFWESSGLLLKRRRLEASGPPM